MNSKLDYAKFDFIRDVEAPLWGVNFGSVTLAPWYTQT